MRRMVGRITVLVGTLVALSLASCATPDATREPMLTNPPKMDAWYGGADPADERTWVERKYDGHAQPPFQSDWSWDLPDPGLWETSRLELCDPVLYGDSLYVGSSRKAGLFVLDRETGHHVRTHPTEGPVQSPPVRLNDGWLLVDTFGILQRLGDDLEVKWTYRSGGAVFRAPRIDGDQILLVLSGDTVVSVGLADGEWRWSHKREVRRGAQELAILGGPRPAAGKGLIFAGFSDGWVAALDPNTGKERWARSIGKGKFPDIQADLMVIDNAVLVSSFSGPTVALDAETGSERWRNEDVGSAWPMVLSDGSLIISDSRGNVHSVNASSGATEWTWALPDTPLLAVFRADRVPAAAQDISTLDGAARAAREAERVARRAEMAAAMKDPARPKGPGPKPNGQVGRPVRAGTHILVGDVNGTLYALNRYDGEEKWRWRPHDGTIPAGVAAAPAIDGRQIVFSTAGGRVVSLVGSTALTVDLSETPGQRRDRRVDW
jgi:outer membrane protein assembly factor BamB